MIGQKIEVIISQSKILLEAIENNLVQDNTVNVTHIDHNYEKAIYSFPKIDLLILDDLIPNQTSLLHVKTIVNLRNPQYTPDDISLKTPLKLAELLKIIKNSRERNQIFCCLNNHWIYDEQLSKLFNQTACIRFTEKENEVFKYLLLTEENKMTKEELFKYIWQYHPDSNSATIETHMSRLRQKLPPHFMQYRDNYYQLIITDIR